MQSRRIIIAVIAVCAVLAIVVYAKRHSSSGSPRSGEHFLPAIAYNPCFMDPLGSSRYTCKGYTSGMMPSIEAGPDGGGLCPGLLGIPP